MSGHYEFRYVGERDQPCCGNPQCEYCKVPDVPCLECKFYNERKGKPASDRYDDTFWDGEEYDDDYDDYDDDYEYDTFGGGGMCTTCTTCLGSGKMRPWSREIGAYPEEDVYAVEAERIIVSFKLDSNPEYRRLVSRVQAYRERLNQLIGKRTCGTGGYAELRKREKEAGSEQNSLDEKELTSLRRACAAEVKATLKQIRNGANPPDEMCLWWKATSA